MVWLYGEVRLLWLPTYSVDSRYVCLMAWMFPSLEGPNYGRRPINAGWGVFQTAGKDRDTEAKALIDILIPDPEELGDIHDIDWWAISRIRISFSLYPFSWATYPTFPYWRRKSTAGETQLPCLYSIPASTTPFLVISSFIFSPSKDERRSYFERKNPKADSSTQDSAAPRPFPGGQDTEYSHCYYY